MIQNANEIALNEESRRLSHQENDVFKLGSNPSDIHDITNNAMKYSPNSTNFSEKETTLVATAQQQTASDLKSANCEETAELCVSEATDSNMIVELCNSPQYPGNASANKEVQKREKRNSNQGAVERIEEKRGSLFNTCIAVQANVTAYRDFDSKGVQNQKETIGGNSAILSEFKVDKEAQRKQKILQTCTTNKMSQDTGPVSLSRSFRLLPAKQRRAKLRKVVLKYKAEHGSDSSFSEGSGDESDIDTKWLESGVRLRCDFQLLCMLSKWTVRDKCTGFIGEACALDVCRFAFETAILRYFLLLRRRVGAQMHCNAAPAVAKHSGKLIHDAFFATV